MILDAATIVLLALEALAVVSNVPLFIAAWPLSFPRAGEDAERCLERARVPLIVAGGLELLTWPILYVTLQGYVPRTRGAMCLLGVMQAGAPLTDLLLIAYPIAALFVLGSVLLLRMEGAGAGLLPASGRRMGAWFMGQALVSIIAGALAYVYVFSDKGEREVSCCTIVLPEAPLAAALERLTPGLDMALFYCGAAGLLLALLGAHRRPERRLSVAGLVLAALIVPPAIVRGLFHGVAPALLGQPDHPCLYDVLPRYPDTVWALAGLFFAWIVTLLSALGRVALRPSNPASLARTLSRWLYAALWAGVLSITLFTYHLSYRGAS